MDKGTKETILAILTLIALFISGYFTGHSMGYDRGLGEGVAISKGDKWDCAYAYSTGFLMCDRTPKYK